MYSKVSAIIDKKHDFFSATKWSSIGRHARHRTLHILIIKCNTQKRQTYSKTENKQQYTNNMHKTCMPKKQKLNTYGIQNSNSGVEIIVTLEQFTEYCNQNSLLPEYQSAYQKEQSCEPSLVKLVNDICWGMENQLVTAVVIQDLNAASDRVDHDLYYMS